MPSPSRLCVLVSLVALALSASCAAAPAGSRGMPKAMYDSAAPAPQEPSGEAAPPKEMLDISANLRVEVEKVAEAAARLRELVSQQSGTIVTEAISDEPWGTTAGFDVRVPAEKAYSFIAALESLGRVRSRQVNVRDIGKEFHDAQLVLENLRATMKRYQEILERAQSVKEVLEVEAELARLRGEIDKIEGELRFMKDRAARATIHVDLTAKGGPELAPEPEAKLHPGLTGTLLWDLRGDGNAPGYAGVGASVSFSRELSFDVAGLRKIGSGSLAKGLDVFIATAGGEVYSDFLGGGRRRFLNPYLGLRIGYSRFLSENELAVGTALGVELYKGRYLSADLQVRALGLFGASGPHLAIQPALGLSAAF